MNTDFFLIFAAELHHRTKHAIKIFSKGLMTHLKKKKKSQAAGNVAKKAK